MIPLRRLRRMHALVTEFVGETRPHAHGSWDDHGPGWSDIDEAHRSLTEAMIYLAGWITYRERHRRDPIPGWAARPA